MSGTLEGGRKAAITNRQRHGKDFYQKLGAKGGSLTAADGVVKGFAANRELASVAGRKGGMKSKRRPTKSSKMGVKEITPPVWQDQNSTDTPSTLSTTLPTFPCASCGNESSELDEMGLCPNCPEVHHVPRRWPFNLKRPF